MNVLTCTSGGGAQPFGFSDPTVDVNRSQMVNVDGVLEAPAVGLIDPVLEACPW